MNNPTYLEQSLHPVFLDRPLESNHHFSSKDKNGALIITFPKNSKEKISLVITSDVQFNQLELVFPKDSYLSINLLYHFRKNASRDIKILLHQGSNIKITETYLTSRNVKTNLNRILEIDQNAHLLLSSGLFMDGEHTFKDELLLKGENASIDFDTLTISHHQDRFSTIQDIRHQAKNTVSNVHNLMVSNNHSTIEFYVNGYIAKGMSGSNCKQQNRGVILSETGIIRVDPKLFIDEYDVEAGHGAAIGQINEDEMFYLLSRGLSESEAKRLILQGYTEPFVLSLDEGALKKTINQRIARKVKGE
ncbi:MAG: SufD family Fe-S cluster assembly protein [Firmicutes bacterium]|nr:SufD family Fe-S cluster assembly protein [Bacillota bacterium]